MSDERAIPRILHVLPYDQPRGAQRYARQLVDHMQDGSARHEILTLFQGEPSNLNPDFELGLGRGPLRSLGFDPRVLRRFSSMLRGVSPDIVVAHGGESAKYTAMVLGPVTPMVYLNIGSAHPRLGRQMSSMFHRFYTRRADVIVTVSEALAEEAVRMHRVPAEKIVVIPNGRDPGRFRPASPSEVRERPRVTWIGQLDAAKRPEVMIHVVEALRKEGLDFDAGIVGIGPRLAEITPSAETAGVEMLGEIHDVPELLRSSDILLFTARPPEGMPGVLIEAGLTGLPVVSTRVPGADEVIEDGVTGRLVDIDDVSGMVSSVRYLLTDDEGRQQMGQWARERCVARFSLDVTVDKWENLFLHLLVNRRRRR